MWDAIVAGAGPAGAVAAVMLARRGHRVLLADDVVSSARKIGDALPGAAVRLLRSLGLPSPVSSGPHSPIGGNLVSWNSETLVPVDFLCDPSGTGWLLDRPRFDSDLRAAAAAAGAVPRTARVREICRVEGHWRIGFDDGSTEVARWIVDATGRRASLARRLGVERRREARLVALYAFGDARTPGCFNRTVLEAVSTGWWYAASLPCGACVTGFHTNAREAARLRADRQAWNQAFAGARHVGSMFAHAGFGERPHGVEACGARLARFGGDGWVACGDAAMSFDPISGQGIFGALHGGMAAGSAVADALAGDDASLVRAAELLERVWTIYRARCATAYRSESRWPTAPFWSTFGQLAA
jgi:flavin-dependent dehydrogenase